jgi:hypothetical protein
MDGWLIPEPQRNLSNRVGRPRILGHVSADRRGVVRGDRAIPVWTSCSTVTIAAAAGSNDNDGWGQISIFSNRS